MRVPQRFRWTVRDGGDELAVIEATPDSTLRYGHGRGYVGAYSYHGEYRRRPVTGTRYFERIDCE
jgi:hypothetical protein